jgi:hypothetical protein
MENGGDDGGDGDDDEEEIPGTTTRHNSGARTRQGTAGATDNDAERGMTLPNAGRQRQTQDDNAKRRTTTPNAGRQRQTQDDNAERRTVMPNAGDDNDSTTLHSPPTREWGRFFRFSFSFLSYFLTFFFFVL